MSDDIGVSIQDMIGLLKDAKRGNLDEEKLRKLWTKVDDQQKSQAIGQLYEEAVVPHARDIKQRADQSKDPEDIRQEYAQLSDEKQQEIFDQAVADLVGTLFEIREDPLNGWQSLKGLLRDPYTIEGLLLIFDNEEHIDPEYSEQMKDFASWYIKALGVAAAPEMYEQATVEEIYNAFNLAAEQQQQQR